MRISKKTTMVIRKKSLNVEYDGVPGGIRTHDPLLRRQPLCPLSYRDL
jgi:hypothetical protein